MRDKELAILIRGQLLPRMQASASLATVGLVRDFQNRQQGAASGPTVYFHKLFEKRHGSPQRREEWDELAGEFVHAERQVVESTYQFSAWVPQNPANTTELTPGDVLAEVCGIMQSDSLRAAFLAAGVGIFRVTEVRNPYVTNERDEFEAVPSFDIVLIHERANVSTLPAVVTYEANISRV